MGTGDSARPGPSQPQAPCLGEKDSTALNNQRPVAAAESAVYAIDFRRFSLGVTAPLHSLPLDWLVNACTLLPLKEDRKRDGAC